MSACAERWKEGAETHLSRSLTTELGLWPSFLARWVSVSFLDAACKTPASIGDSESRDVKAVGGNGFLRTGEEVGGYTGKEMVRKLAGGVGF